MLFRGLPIITTLFWLFLSIQRVAFGQDNYLNVWKSKVFLDRSRELDLSIRRKTIIVIPVGAPGVGDSTEWKGLLNKGSQNLEQSQGGEFSVAFLPASVSEGLCVEEGKLTGICATTASEVASRGGDMIVILHSFKTDSASYQTYQAAPAPIGSIPGGIGSFASVPVLHMSADLVVAEASTGKVLYHARNTTDGTSAKDIRTEFTNQLTARLAKLFDPLYLANVSRNVLSIHPIGIVLTAANFGLYQFTYERLLGEGRSALYWNPVFAINNEDTKEEIHHIHYLLFPIAGYRYYLRSEGQGIWFGAKGGYSYFEFISKSLSYYPTGDCQWTKAHMGFLAGELGTSYPLGRLRIHFSGTIGLGMGWKKTIMRDPYGSAKPKDERGFGVLPVFDASTGLGWAF